MFFGDFPETAKLLTTSLAALTAAKTKLGTGESPTLLAPAAVGEVAVAFDHDDNPSTPSVPMTLKDVFLAGPGYDGSGRMDTVFGQGPDGELYVLNKRNGWIYLATNTVPLGPLGDFDYNHIVDAADLGVFVDEFGLFGSARTADADSDNDVDGADVLAWQRSLGAALSWASARSVPEPSGTLVASVFVLTWVLVRRGV